MPASTRSIFFYGSYMSPRRLARTRRARRSVSGCMAARSRHRFPTAGQRGRCQGPRCLWRRRWQRLYESVAQRAPWLVSAPAGRIYTDRPCNRCQRRHDNARGESPVTTRSVRQRYRAIASPGCSYVHLPRPSSSVQRTDRLRREEVEAVEPWGLDLVAAWRRPAFKAERLRDRGAQRSQEIQVRE